MTGPTDALNADERQVQPEFTGTAAEYFRIWIVNLFFTLATLGIYSAWAKVRKRRYFYGSTRLDGDSFDYFASPKAILNGRIIAVAIFAIYARSEEHTSELQSRSDLVCRLLLEKKNTETSTLVRCRQHITLNTPGGCFLTASTPFTHASPSTTRSSPPRHSTTTTFPHLSAESPL